MTGCDDPDVAALDAHMRTQFAKAAETYASQIDLDARLTAILAVAKQIEADGTAAADS
jgi:hypothetical protein